MQKREDGGEGGLEESIASQSRLLRRVPLIGKKSNRPVNTGVSENPHPVIESHIYLDETLEEGVCHCSLCRSEAQLKKRKQENGLHLGDYSEGRSRIYEKRESPCDLVGPFTTS